MSRLSLGISRLSIPRLSDARRSFERSFERISNYFHKKDTVQLKRELSLMSTVNLIVNGTIGSGIFVTPGIVLSHSGSTGMSLFIWSICGGISLLGALAFAELGMVIPRSGGQYAFYQAAFRDLHPFYGPITGFVYVWMNVLVIYPSSLAILVLTFADYIYEPAKSLFNADIHGQRERVVKQLIGFLALGIMAYTNFVSVKLYVRVQNIFSYFKITVCVLIIYGGFYMTVTGKANKMYIGFDDTDYSIKALIMAFYSGLYTFDGWCIVTGVTEEIKNPDKNILRSVLIAVPLVTLLYLCVNTAYLTALTVPQVVLQPAVAVAFADIVYGQMKLVVSVGVAFSAFGTGLCTVFAASRLCYVAAREGHMIDSFSYIHMTRLTPTPAITLQIALTALFLLSGDIISLINFSNFLVWIFYGLTMVTVFVLRHKKPNANRPYKVPLVIPAIVTVISIMLAIIPLVTQPPLQYVAALILMVTGIFVYYPVVYKKKRLPGMDSFRYFIQVFFEVVPTSNPEEFN